MTHSTRDGTLDERYPLLYQHFKHFHGAAKAVELPLNARRRDRYTLDWIRAIWHWKH